MRLNASLSAAVYATYLDFGSINALEVDPAGNLVMAGQAAGCVQCGTPPFPAVNPIPGVNQAPGFPAQAYITKLNPAGSATVFATLLHGDDRNSTASDLKLEADGTAILLGYGYGEKFPIADLIPYGLPENTPAPQEPVPFLAKIGPTGGELRQSTLFYGPEFVSFPSFAFPGRLQLAVLADGRTCLMNVTSRRMQQTPGALGAVSSSTNYPATLMCLDASGTGVETKTFLPDGAVYSEMASTPDGALLFASAALESFATTVTPGAFQTRFEGLHLAFQATLTRNPFPAMRS